MEVTNKTVGYAVVLALIICAFYVLAVTARYYLVPPKPAIVDAPPIKTVKVIPYNRADWDTFNGQLALSPAMFDPPGGFAAQPQLTPQEPKR
jgi:hypothetical protein